jgi:hypothetical protein
MVIHWTVNILTPKSQNKYIEAKASAYLYDEVYRICFSHSKQKYYFEIPVDALWFTEDVIQTAELYFNEHRNELSVAKCIRCSKWHVLEGQFCPRCEGAKNDGNTELDIEI